MMRIELRRPTLTTYSVSWATDGPEGVVQHQTNIEAHALKPTAAGVILQREGRTVAYFAIDTQVTVRQIPGETE